MPFTITTTAAVETYANPTIGPIGPTVNLDLDVDKFTSAHVDADGYLIPGLPITKAGTPIGTVDAAGTAVAAAVAGNTGNGAMGAVTVSAGAKAGVYKLTIIEPAANAGAFIVQDPYGVIAGHGNVAAAYSSGGLAFTLADGATDFVSGDQFNITVSLTAGDEQDIAFGIILEACKIASGNTDTILDAAANCYVAVCTDATINRDIAEDNLGRSYTTAELAALTAGGFKVTPT